MITITPQLVQDAIKKQHPNRAICVELAQKLKLHADGLIPTKLILERRPNENAATFEYRKKIYEPITEEPIGKVINSLSKIRRSQDWIIAYGGEVNSRIASGESLEDYCENNFPSFQSITNWAFSELLMISLIDANSVCAVILKQLPQSKAEYVKPEIEIFTSEQIIDYIVGEYYVLKSNDVVKVIDGGVVRNNEIYWVLTQNQIFKYERESSGSVREILTYNHNIGEIPCQKVGGLFYKRVNNDTIQKSRIAKMVPFLNEAAREYSDLQAEIVQHAYSEKYVYTNQECEVCRGTGHVRKENGERSSCSVCGGRGKISSSPYGVYTFDAQKLGEQSLPNIPVGYIAKNTDIARFMQEHIDNHIYRALASINMEFLADRPLNQSGTAKEIDQDELNNFVSGVAEDIVMVLDRIYYFINEYRYNVIIPQREERLKMLPRIPVPERFGLVNSGYMMSEIGTAKNSNVSRTVVKYMELEYVRKKYNAQPEIVKEVEALFDLDPLYGYDQQEKMTMLSNEGITMLDYVVSSNIQQFIQRAIKENNDFLLLPFEQKKAKIDEYAAEIINKNSAAQQIKEGINVDLE